MTDPKCCVTVSRKWTAGLWLCLNDVLITRQESDSPSDSTNSALRVDKWQKSNSKRPCFIVMLEITLGA